MISTQRYRLPVRRYIFELFNQEMNQDLVNAFDAAATKLEASPSYKPPRTAFRISVFSGKSRRTSESDESDEDDGRDTLPTKAKPPEEPTFNLQPMKRIVGFGA